jgi:phosphoribosylformimino-5-aminoimidazole carboxamide ribotide isomerase
LHYRIIVLCAGGITADNAAQYLAAGASHVIVTSFVFREGSIDYERLDQLVAAVGKDRLVLDLSCRKRRRDGSAASFDFVVATDRWQKFTDCTVNAESLTKLSRYCSEFLVHGIDVEGMRAGIEVGGLLRRHR